MTHVRTTVSDRKAIKAAQSAYRSLGGIPAAGSLTDVLGNPKRRFIFFTEVPAAAYETAINEFHSALVYNCATIVGEPL